MSQKYLSTTGILTMKTYFGRTAHDHRLTPKTVLGTAASLYLLACIADPLGNRAREQEAWDARNHALMDGRYEIKGNLAINKRTNNF